MNCPFTRDKADCPHLPAECDGWQFDEERNVSYQCRAGHTRDQRLEAEGKLKSARITPRFLTRTLDNYSPQDASQQSALRLCRDYIANFSESTTDGIGFTGPVGTGKTHLMAGMVNGLMAKGVECLYVSAADLAGELRQSIKSGELESLIDRVCSVRFLALDDLGAERSSDFWTEAGYRIINSRYEGLLPTCFTSNLDRAGIAQHLGARIESRLSEMAKWSIVKGSDYRKGNANGQR